MQKNNNQQAARYLWSRMTLSVRQSMAALGWLGLLVAGVHASPDAPPIDFNIQSQPMAAALNSLAIQANCQMFFEDDVVAGLTAPTVAGRMSTHDALHVLLANSALEYSQDDGGAIIVRRKAIAPTTARASKTPRVHASQAIPTDSPPVTAPAQTPRPVIPAQGNWMVGLRGAYIDTANGSTAFGSPNATVDVARNGVATSDRWLAEVDLEYFLSSHWSGELALLAPRRYDLNVHNASASFGAGHVGSFTQLPSYLTFKYTFAPSANWRPYIGIGANVTSFYGVDATPYGVRSTSVGPAAQAGLNVKLARGWFLNADVKWARARTDLRYEGADVSTLRMDPLTYGLGIAYRFGAAAASVAPPVATPAPMPPAPPMDSDRDGVPDSRAQCPNTPAGLKVDAHGCEIEELVLKGVTFETGSSKPKPQSFKVLDDLASLLNLRPNSKAEIHGYTDSVGAVSYNQTLSELRARAVADYLVEHGIVRANLNSRGFGKADPVASNATAEGRAENRRVTVQFQVPVPR